MATFRLTKGYDVRLAGEPVGDPTDAPYPAQVAIKPIQLRGMRPRPAVEVGDRVQAGDPLIYAKHNEAYKVAAPASGTVAAVNRGPKRVIESIVIDTDGERAARRFTPFDAARIASLDRGEVVDHLLETGLLPLFQQRPFGHIADPDRMPRDIFVTAIDTAPLAPDPALAVTGAEAAFQAGLDVCRALTDGAVHLCLDGARSDLPKAFGEARGVEIHHFSGPHPAGCAGVHIHHIAPIRGRGDIVWTIDVQGLVLIGKLFLEGCLRPEITIAVTGPAAPKPGLRRTVLGASLRSLLGDAPADADVRYVAGNALTGHHAGPDGFLGLSDHQITLLREAREPELIGWMLPGFRRESRSWAFVSGFLPGGRFDTDTRYHGGPRAFVKPELYQSVLPMDIYPVYLIKSILANDFDEMEGLGIYEVTEEEFAICEYICPSKIEIQQILRSGLELVHKEG